MEILLPVKGQPGCVRTNPQCATGQDLSGTELGRAPGWTGNIGFNYEAPVTTGLKMGLSGFMTYSDSYLTEAHRLTTYVDRLPGFLAHVAQGSKAGAEAAMHRDFFAHEVASFPYGGVYHGAEGWWRLAMRVNAHWRFDSIELQEAIAQEGGDRICLPVRITGACRGKTTSHAGFGPGLRVPRTGQAATPFSHLIPASSCAGQGRAEHVSVYAVTFQSESRFDTIKSAAPAVCFFRMTSAFK